MKRHGGAWAPAFVVLAVGCLAAGCGNGGIEAAASKAASALPSRSATFSPPSRASAAATATSEPTPPATTAAPTTTALTTAPPTTATPASSAPSARPSSSSSAPAASGSLPAALWLWVLAGVLALAALTAGISLASRRSAKKKRWQSAVTDAYARGSALADAIRVAEWQQPRQVPDGTARWADIQRRMNDLGQALYRMRAAAPSEKERIQVEAVLDGLQAVRSELAAAPSPYAPAVERQSRLHGRLQFFEDAVRELREGGRL